MEISGRKAYVIEEMEPTSGLEPLTCRLRISNRLHACCS